MQPESTAPEQPTTAIGVSPDEQISDEEANEEIDIPEGRPAPPRANAAPVARTGDSDDITPSVRKAVGKAADILRAIRETDAPEAP